MGAERRGWDGMKVNPSNDKSRPTDSPLVERARIAFLAPHGPANTPKALGPVAGVTGYNL